MVEPKENFVSYRLRLLQSWLVSNTALYKQQNCSWCIVALGNRLSLTTLALMSADAYWGHNEWRAIRNFAAKFGIDNSDVHMLYEGRFPHNCCKTDNPDAYSTDDAINVLDVLIKKYEGQTVQI